MVGWTYFGTMQSIFLPLKCGFNCYIILYIMELLNGTCFEIIDFNIYVMKLISMQIYKIIEGMDFWNYKSTYVALATIKWMDFGLILWWTSKKFRELVFTFTCNNEIKFEMFWFMYNEFFDKWIFIWWKHTHILKSPFHLEKKWFILKFC